MSQQTIQMFPHQQEQSKVVGKIANNHIVKVHILSNEPNLGGHTYQYDDVKNIPESFLNELVGLPAPQEHDVPATNELYFKLEKEGKTDCEIRQALIESRKLKSVGIVDDVYRPVKISYNAVIPEVDLYGTIEITDPVENEYIEKNGAPSHKYTSISTFGPYVVKPDGIIYNELVRVRPFELALVKDPAFGKHKAFVRGVCKDEKSVCRNRLAYASVLPEGIVTEKMESINTDSNVINNMSKQTAEVPTVPEKTPENTVPATVKEIVEDKTLNTPEDKKVPATVVKEKDVVAPQQKEEQNPAPKNESSSGNKELDELRAQLEQTRKEVEERKRTYRNDLLSFTLDPKTFKSEEEYESEKNNVMSIFEKYNFSDDHAKWLVTKAFPRMQQTSAPNSEGNKKPAVYNSISYSPSEHIKSVSQSTDSAPVSNSNNKKKRIDLIELQY
jgi:hypothetical protein